MENKAEINLARFAYLSIVTSIITLAMKSAAYWLTGSVGLLSDALESVINLAASILALKMIKLASTPPDREHPFGHGKAEYFSSVTEGAMILVAAVTIGVAAIERIINPHDLQKLGTGLIISCAASVLNGMTAFILIRAGRKYRSITLEADGKHLFTDVLTTGGVLAGLVMVGITGWSLLDPLIAIFVAVNIVVTGIRLIMRSVSGLMDSAISLKDLNAVKKIMNSHRSEEIRYHSLYTRQSGRTSFVFLHLLVPGDWHINRAHEFTKKIENEIKSTLPYSDVFIHIEPLNDPDSFDDYLRDSRNHQKKIAND